MNPPVLFDPISTTSWDPISPGPDVYRSPDGPPPTPPIAKVIAIIAYTSIFLCGILGNASVCYIIVRDLKISVTNLFLLNLSLADILMGIFCGHFVMLRDFVLGYWPFGTPLCKMVPTAQGLSMLVSALTHVVISVDRFMVVYRPLRPRIRHRSAVYILILTWMVAAMVVSPMPFVNTTVGNGTTMMCQEDWSIFIKYNISEQLKADMASSVNFTYSILLMIVQYFLPLTVLVSTYSAIAFRVWIQETPGEVDAKRDQRIAKSKRKLLKMVILVALLYGLSQLPRHAFFLISIRYFSWWVSQHGVLFICSWMACDLIAFTSITYNPFIYCWMNKLFRRGFISILWRIMPCCLERCGCCEQQISRRDNKNTICMTSTDDKQHSVFIKKTCSYQTGRCNSEASETKLLCKSRYDNVR